MPDTGGSNVPALNDLLSPWGIALGEKIFDGEFHLGEHSMMYSSGTHIAQFPASGTVISVLLKDQG